MSAKLNTQEEKIFNALDQLHKDLCELEKNPNQLPASDLRVGVTTLLMRITQSVPAEALEDVTLRDWVNPQ